MCGPEGCAGGRGTVKGKASAPALLEQRDP